MPYGSTYRRTRARRPGGPVRRLKRATVRPPPKKRTTRTYVRSNALAVNRLTRDVQFLKRARHGKVQMNLQHFSVPIRPSSTEPYAIDITQFDYRRVNSANVIIPGTPVYQWDTHAGGITTPASFFAGPATSTNYHGANPLWAGLTTDIPDGGQYLPISSTYNFTITGATHLVDAKVTFTLMREKKRTTRTALQTLGMNMPHSLRYMDNISDKSLNCLPPDRFKVYWSRSVYINSRSDQTKTGATTGNIKSFSFTVKHKGGVKRQNKTFPNDTDTLPVQFPTESHIDPDLDFGPFGMHNTDPLSALWLVISSTDSEGTTAQVPIVHCSRKVYWRDQVGGM